jgi:hypothetical protein
MESMYLLLHDVSVLTRYNTYADTVTHRQAFIAIVLAESARGRPSRLLAEELEDDLMCVLLLPTLFRINAYLNGIIFVVPSPIVSPIPSELLWSRMRARK